MERVLEYAASHPFMAGGLVFMTAIVIAYEVQRVRRRGVDVSPTEAVALINAGALPVDLRPVAQFEKGHLLEARNVPVAELEQQAAALAKLNRTLLVYCETGTSAPRAAAQLNALGLADVKTLRGGITAWRQESLPVVSGRKPRRA